MAITIKSQRVCDLARQAAAVSGLSQVGAIEAALTAFLRQNQSIADQDARRRCDEVIAAIQASVTDEDRAAMRRFEAQMYGDPELSTPSAGSR